MAVTANQVQSLYLAYFGRPAEQAGLTYWTSQTNATVDQISAAFAQQPEYTSTYAGLNRAQTIQELYTNLFNRSASDAEINYWNASQDITVDRLALALVNGASGNDAVALANKVDISNVITLQAGTAGTADSVRATANSNAGANFDQVFTATATQSASQQAAEFYAAQRATFVGQTQFSINGDNVVNGSGNVAGSTGNPALSFFSATNGTLNATNAGTVAIALPSDSAVTALTVKGTVGDVAGTATADASVLTFTEALGTNETATVLTSLSLALSNSAVAPTSTTINANGIDSLTTIDGSASSAALTINTTGTASASSLINLTTLNGGSGNDVLTASTIGAAGDTVAALTVNGGAGNDQINGTTGSAALTLNGGDGVDTITLTTTGATAASTVNAGAGNDAVILVAGNFGTGTSHAVNIDLGAGNDTLKVNTLSNLHANETTTQLGQDLIKVAGFNAGDKLDLSGIADSYQALSTSGAANVAAATTLLAAITAAAADVGGTPTGTPATTVVAHTTSFQYGGNTYVVHADNVAGIGAGDGVIELTGYQGNFVATAGAATGNFTAA